MLYSIQEQLRVTPNNYKLANSPNTSNKAKSHVSPAKINVKSKD